MRLTARVPATSANLGPGFDCFGLALDLCNEVTLDTDAEPGVTWEGEGARELPTDGSDAVSAAIRRAAATAEGGSRRVPAFALHGLNRIPLERGLGSSSAAGVAGAALALALFGEPADPQRAFAIAATIEGHPDNAAAAAFGGLTVVVDRDQVRRFDPHPDLRPVVLVPDGTRISTTESRRRLPDPVRREDAVYNVGHAALTLAGLVMDPELLFGAMRDRLHEDERLSLVPAVRPIYQRVRDAGVAVCLSGSGPALLAFERDGYEVPEPAPGWNVLRVPIRSAGVEVVA